MPLTKPNQEKLEHLLQEQEYTHAMDYLMKHAREGVRLAKREIADYSKTCVSRIGGDPDLPDEIEWPLDRDGTPMTFLAQLRLEDLAPHDAASRLSHGGVLYFFLGVDEPAYHIEHFVLHLKDEQLAGAKRRFAPEETSLEDADFTGYEVVGRASIELPGYGYVDSEQVEDDEHDYEEYEDLTHELSGSEDGDLAVMFGYPATQHGDCEIEAALMLMTGKHYEYSPEKAMKQLAAHFAGDEGQAEQEVADTLVLLTLDSDNDVGFCWWDAGELQFYIRKEDLLAGNFTRTYCSLYSS
ncbi:Uncharacterized protein YwqG [Paenibacillus algorifonticola]|uniref:Uncharacterized protein YwqG n=1 Tax=Paenibacillus algorifonticola TaxID=684063 RepID=A0A1I2HMD4_9BACL|nr:YwqG family protein [Paenibacillus algorifonticola]SFF31455.1 Uncharacterized protein YwqG [Paenibacillus algorifonticola]